MSRVKLGTIFLVTAVFLLGGASGASAAAQMYCPATVLDNATGRTNNDNVFCFHFAAGDGFTQMADGAPMYIFGFQNVQAKGYPVDNIMSMGMLGATFPGPVLQFKEGKSYYVGLTNVGMFYRPDLFDPHTIHFHGFPNQIPFYDGEPMGSFGTTVGYTLTYFYQPHDPGTYMFHCHQEASEHMQMGMLSTAFIDPIQNDNAAMIALGSARVGGVPYQGFVYNDGDGATGYDNSMTLQLAAFDPVFHNNDMTYQPTRFAGMDDLYPMFNGRGYPDTVNSAVLDGLDPLGNPPYLGSRPMNSLIVTQPNRKFLMRIFSLSTTTFNTIESPSIPMNIVGRDARIYRGGGLSTGLSRMHLTNSVTLGGGEAIDVMLDTTGVAPGTYFLYSRALDQLNNNRMPRGGMMTEIQVQ